MILRKCVITLSVLTFIGIIMFIFMMKIDLLYLEHSGYLNFRQLLTALGMNCIPYSLIDIFD